MSDSSLIYLVRHGEAAARWGQSADPGLSELGLRQAKAAAEGLEAQLTASEISLVSSPLLRAQETAGPLAERLATSVTIDERFREIPSPVPLAQRQDWLRGFMRQEWTVQHESLHAWRESIVQAVEQLPGSTVVFTHFLVINALVGWYTQREETLVFWPDNASITVLERSPSQISVSVLGDQMSTVVN
ncbi:histidine phosphatase family protein [Congregibacter variabilis]|uniref:Histidine phosphatase family protein n=1 Tax=Congregibacter variabilis TaxID=3081200 RepID=A0ABZ0I3N8_9GAMM|nr:histidine phosphatase family protein [Congregibacter sp. IMCC43200]